MHHPFRRWCMVKGFTTMSITSKLRDLIDFKIEPGFSVGVGLKIVIDSSGTDYHIVREDGAVVLSYSSGDAVISVTTLQLTQTEKTAITRMFRVIRPGFTPDWDMWRMMRLRTRKHRIMLPAKPM
nr:MAG TPA: hypothetical protein [Caudoviricetes sp.]